MKKISNSAIISFLMRILVLLVVAKGISFAIWLYLPSTGVELNIKENYQPRYQRVDFKNMIQRVKKGQKEESERIVNSIGTSITNMILKGLYGTKNSGFIIIALKADPKKTEIIAVGEIYKGYTLKSITPLSAIFEKNAKDYVLYLEKSKVKHNSSITEVKKISDIKLDSKRAVTRQDISFYSKNPKQIWKDISIVEVKDGDNFKGFKVTKINKKSKFASLGLQVGDLVIKANNIRLKSYRDALNIYKNMGKLDVMQIVVLRNNQEVELVYEIN